MNPSRRLAALTLGAALLLSTPAVGHAAGTDAPPAPSTLTQSAAPADNAVRVGTYNIMKSTLGKGRFGWAKRREALRNAVGAARPDVLLIQEANTQVWRGARHLDDVRGLLGSVGYQIASDSLIGCTAGCTLGAHVFFNPNRMTLAALPNAAVTTGMTGLSLIAGTWDGSIQDRAVSWAFLTPAGSQRPSMYVSVHLPTQKNGTGERLRVAIAQQLRAWADGIITASGLPGAELVIGGDFNSYARRQPNGAQQVVASSGLIDGFNAPERVNANFGSVNYAPKINKYKGFPPRPYFYARIDPCRIDYIFSTVAPLRHEIFLLLGATGKFDNAFRASDHNLVLVDLPLR